MFGLIPFVDTASDIESRRQARKDFYDFLNEPMWNITYQGGKAPDMKCDVKETDTEYDVKCDLPGVDKADIDVDFSPDNVLTISYKKATENDSDDKDKGFIVHERSYASATRCFSLPDGNKDDIHATYVDGVLSVKVGKSVPVKDDSTKITIE